MEHSAEFNRWWGVSTDTFTVQASTTQEMPQKRDEELWATNDCYKEESLFSRGHMSITVIVYTCTRL